METIRCPGCMRTKTQRPLCEHCGYNEHIDNYSHQLPVGTTLRGRYGIGKVLGQGGFGITYIGWDQLKKMPVAIKEFYPKSLVNRENTRTNLVSTMEQEGSEPFAKGKARFLKEARTLARLADNPQIVHIYNFFEENNTAYMVMEYLKGADLRQYIRMKGGRISLEKTFAVMRPIMRALRQVHKEQLVHRDISPDNIMLLPGGRIKLLDFGAAREVLNAAPDKQLSHSTEAVLKQGFAPIEQYQTSGSLGPWTDVYALTATIYYCLTGTVPPEVHKRLLEGARLSWEDIPGLTPDQIRALEQAMAILPMERTQSVAELEDALFAGFPETDRQELDFHVEKNGPDGGGNDAVSAINDWKFSSGGGIVEKVTTREDKKAPEKISANTRVKIKEKKKPGILVLAAVLTAVALAVGCGAAALGGPREHYADPAFEAAAARTIAYEDGSRVEVFLNGQGQETGRLIRDGDQKLVYQLTALYDQQGRLEEQKVYDAGGTLLRTDTYTYDDGDVLTRGQSRNAQGGLLWEVRAVYTDGVLSGFRETRANGAAVGWTVDTNGNVTAGTFFDVSGSLEKTVYYTGYADLYNTGRAGSVDFREAGRMAARGGYGISPMGVWDPGNWGSGGGGGGEPEKPKRPIAVAITEPEETEAETAPTETEDPAMGPAGGQPVPVQIPEETETAPGRNGPALWVNTCRETRSGQGDMLALYTTKYDSQGVALEETCFDQSGQVQYSAGFLYSGGELTGEDRTAGDGTLTSVRYIRDISGNVVWTWTAGGDGADQGAWTKIDLAACYNG